jgi:hypothetical protein
VANHSWTGSWRNEYGSVLHIHDDANGHLTGTFATAHGDSGFAGHEAEIAGIHAGNCAHFAFSRSGEAGDTIASFTGLLRDGALKTVWHVVSDMAVKPLQPGAEPELMQLPWAHAVLTNSDTFTRDSA